ncbi:MAG: thioesterase family protein [Myxococcota bacterium]
MMDAFYVQDGAAFHASPLTRGPWDSRFQHGGPPSALLTGAMARFGEDAERFFLARVTIDLLRPVPIAPVQVTVEPVKMGRTVQRLHARLTVDGNAVLTATAIRIRRSTLSRPPPSEGGGWPEPTSLPPFMFSFFIDDVGYHQAVDLRIARGRWGATPIRFWGRATIPLVAGRQTLPREQVMILADAQSGLGIAVPPSDFTFVNPDLTVYFERDPVGQWLGLDIRTTVNEASVGLAQSELRDSRGVIGRSAQSLLVAARG